MKYSCLVFYFSRLSALFVYTFTFLHEGATAETKFLKFEKEDVTCLFEFLYNAFTHVCFWCTAGAANTSVWWTPRLITVSGCVTWTINIGEAHVHKRFLHTLCVPLLERRTIGSQSSSLLQSRHSLRIIMPVSDQTKLTE